MNSINPQWADMSEFVVHFTRAYDGKDCFDNIMGIYIDSKIDARNPFGIGRTLAPISERPTKNALMFQLFPAAKRG